MYPISSFKINYLKDIKILVSASSLAISLQISKPSTGRKCRGNEGAENQGNSGLVGSRDGLSQWDCLFRKWSMLQEGGFLSRLLSFQLSACSEIGIYLNPECYNATTLGWFGV